MTAKIVPIRMSLTEAMRKYIAERDWSGENSLFGFCLREDTDDRRLQAARYDLDRAIQCGLVRLYARPRNSGEAWRRLQLYTVNGLHLKLFPECAECEVWPHFRAIVPTDFSVLRSDIVRLIKRKQVERWMAS